MGRAARRSRGRAGDRQIPLELARSSASSLRDPLLFVAVAVPLAVALDRLGVFEALAALVDGGRHLPMALWWFGAAVTAVFNLDAAVVLLTRSTPGSPVATHCHSNRSCSSRRCWPASPRHRCRCRTSRT
ncbi:MAG: hypothetical protein R2713_09270 [Ilumatobacteraceae bacterium]